MIIDHPGSANDTGGTLPVANHAHQLPAVLRLVNAARRHLATFPVYRSRPIGAEGSRARLEQSDQIATEDALRDAIHAALTERFETPTSAMIDAGVAFALNVSVSGQGGWSKYVAGLWETMEAARLRETPIPTGGVGLEPTSTTDAGRAPGTNQSPIQQTEPS